MPKTMLIIFKDFMWDIKAVYETLEILEQWMFYDGARHNEFRIFLDVAKFLIIINSLRVPSVQRLMMTLLLWAW